MLALPYPELYPPSLTKQGLFLPSRVNVLCMPIMAPVALLTIPGRRDPSFCAPSQGSFSDYSGGFLGGVV